MRALPCGGPASLLAQSVFVGLTKETKLGKFELQAGQCCYTCLIHFYKRCLLPILLVNEGSRQDFDPSSDGSYVGHYGAGPDAIVQVEALARPTTQAQPLSHSRKG